MRSIIGEFRIRPRKECGKQNQAWARFCGGANPLEWGGLRITNNLAEPRKLVIGKIEQKYWTAVIAERGENIRIISVRRSRRKEIEIYENRKS